MKKKTLSFMLIVSIMMSVASCGYKLVKAEDTVEDDASISSASSADSAVEDSVLNSVQEYMSNYDAKPTEPSTSDEGSIGDYWTEDDYYDENYIADDDPYWDSYTGFQPVQIPNPNAPYEGYNAGYMPTVYYEDIVFEEDASALLEQYNGQKLRICNVKFSSSFSDGGKLQSKNKLIEVDNIEYCTTGTTLMVDMNFVIEGTVCAPVGSEAMVLLDHTEIFTFALHDPWW